MTGTTGGNLAALARGGSLNLVGAAVTGVAQFALVVVVAAAYPLDVTGAFFAASSVFIILGAVGELGTDVGLGLWVPRHLALERSRSAARTVVVALVPVLVVSVVTAAVMFAAAPWIGDLIAADRAAETVTMLRLLAVFLPISAVGNVLLSATRGHGRMRPTVIIDRIGRPLGQIIGILVVSRFTTDPGLLGLMWALPYLPSLVAAAVVYGRLHRQATGESPPVREIAGEFWRFTSFRAVSRVCQTAFQRVDIVMIAALSSPLDAAVYTAATRFVVFGQLSSQAVQQVMQPIVSRQLALEDWPEVRETFRVTTIWSVLLAWPVYLVTAVAAPAYLLLFGDAYVSAGEVTVIILSVAMLVATAAGPVDTMLLMSGRSGLSLTYTVASLAVQVGLGALLIPSWGLIGAALARAAAVVARNVLSYAQVRLSMRMTPFSPGLGWAVAATSLCFAVPLLAARGATPAPAFWYAAIPPAVAVYVALLWKIRGHVALTALSALLPRRVREASALSPVKEI